MSADLETEESDYDPLMRIVARPRSLTHNYALDGLSTSLLELRNPSVSATKPGGDTSSRGPRGQLG